MKHIRTFFASLASPHPARDWFFGLVSIFIIFLTLASYALYLYSGLEPGSLFVARTAIQPLVVTLTRADINSTLDMYRTRALNYVAHNLPAPAVTELAK
ncbi:hypothetical protein HY090_00755 [Candidatus Kaiserbacteria bacterium]|nr:hypothetical protein [Candidatus Kaiserbacteria bacterium]